MALLLLYSSLIALILAFPLLHRSSAAAKQPPESCTDYLVKFSPCLSYVSSPPNNLSDVVPSRCCESFSSAFDTGEAICLCYLLQEPRIFGFPIDEARVLSLSSVCPLSNDSSARSGSLQSLCSGSETLPPLYSATISGISGPSTASGPDNESSPKIRTPPQPKNSSFPPEVVMKPPPPPPDSPTEEVPSSAAKNQFCCYFCCLVPGILIFLHFPFWLFL
ncbi:non-specific lipid transfer protein GPI-anchored 25 [Ziziphus jujuba]|uniref:Non-specific lipid transfer protein GPI-anchored 25 n=1 Tax=Ziziphus jujuba TaxID=326968 RepID=A0A6P4APK3_ZIZJJ|nr:non-specific lipid transfer protein GPI-anchored 25 [Ziziphus jujuba]